MKDYLPLISAIIGVLFGGTLQYWLGRHSKKGEGFDKLQSDAYVDFMRGVADVVIAQRYQDSKAETTAKSLMLDAKVRIGIYGAPDIAHGVGDYFEKYGDMSKEEDMKAFVDLMHKMRANVVGSADKADWVALSKILFSKNLNV